MKDLKLLKKQLEIERENLNRLIDEAMEDGTPISRTQTIIEQSQKIGRIIENIESDNRKKTEGWSR